jgi:hypothetical protein
MICPSKFPFAAGLSLEDVTIGATQVNFQIS